MFVGGKARVSFSLSTIDTCHEWIDDICRPTKNKQEDTKMELCSRGQRFLEDFPGIPATISLWQHSCSL